jgi:hypothetical protein
VSEWSEGVYGNPCRECGFRWTGDVDAAVKVVLSIPGQISASMRHETGTARLTSLRWSSVGYVCHIVDNLRIWAERIAAAMQAEVVVAPYDSDALGQARCYENVPLAGALWSLRDAVNAWANITSAGRHQPIALFHPDRGRLTLDDVVEDNAHDAYHHAWDIDRIECDAP